MQSSSCKSSSVCLSLVYLFQVFLILTSLFATKSSAFQTSASSFRLCEEGMPLEGTLHYGLGPYSVEFNPPLRAGNTYEPKETYNITLTTTTKKDIILEFFVTPMNKKTGNIMNVSNAVLGPFCPGKSRGIVETFEARTSKTLRKAIGRWTAPEKRSGTCSFRWTAVDKRQSVFRYVYV